MSQSASSVKRDVVVAVVGAGQVGATTAQRLIEKNLAHAQLIDVAEGLAAGKALDLMQAAPIEGHSKWVKGSSDWGDLRGADFVVITAGIPRKPGMSREDLVATNASIIKTVCGHIKNYAPQSIVIIVTNPLDIMTDLAAKALGFPARRVIGMAGVLDSARMRYFLSVELGCLPAEVEATVLGGHGDLMVPVMSQVTQSGRPVRLSPEKEKEIVTRTQNGGAEVVKLLKSGSAFYAPASSVCRMIEAMIKETKQVLPVCARCEGEYGVQGYCGVPAVLNAQGVEKIIELNLSPEEARMLQESTQKVQAGIQELAEMKVH